MSDTQYQTLVALVKNSNTEECIEWPYVRSKSGHGDVRHPVHKRSMPASRAAFELANGYLPEVVRHSCDNPPCVNATHLIAGNHQDNVADRVSRNRSAIGEGNGRSKLLELDVIEIFLSTDSISNLARTYDVDRKAVRNIKSEKVWNAVTKRLHEGDSWSVTTYEYDPGTKETCIENKTLNLN